MRLKSSWLRGMLVLISFARLSCPTTILIAESMSLVSCFSRISSPAYLTVIMPYLAPFLVKNHFSKIPSFYDKVGFLSVRSFIVF